MQEEGNPHPRSTYALLEEVFVQARELAMKKDDIYRQSWRKRGWMGNLARVFTKSDRLENMLFRDGPVPASDESVEDNLLDLINIAAFALVNYREDNKWGSEL